MQLARIVIGVDLTNPSTRAAKWVATSFAPDAEIILLHCLSPMLVDRRLPGARDAAEHCLRGLQHAIGVERCRVRIRIGDPARCLADVAADADADLIAVGAHEEHGDRLPALGSTGERLVSCSPVPVLLCAATPSGAPRSVLLPVDGVEVATELAEWTGTLAERFDAQLALIHVEPCKRRQRLTSESLSQSANSMTPWSRVARERPPHRVFVDAVLGDPADAVLTEARRFGTELLLLQAPDDGTAGPDSATNRVLRRSECPVLVIPSVESTRLMVTR
jgi:nucleotide-binding universal stress UspA family protein